MTSPLALLGGSASIRQAAPHFSWPPLTNATTRAVLDQLDEAISVYDRSSIVARLEDALQDYFGTRFAVLTNSGTAALYSMYYACGIGPGDEVIVPAYTFFATATPLLHLGATPVLADCDTSGNLDPDDLPRRITDRTKAIVATHMWGMPAQVHNLRRLADDRGLQLLEDASHAHGAAVKGKKVGTFGRAAAFSMNGPKPLSAGEGGFVLTDDEDVYHRVLLHGQYNKRCRNEIPAEAELSSYAVTGVGLKHRIHPLAAAIALQQLSHLDDYLIGRRRVAEHIAEALEQMHGLTVTWHRAEIRPSWYGLTLRYDPESFDGVPIERFHAALQAEGCREIDRPGSTCPLNQLKLFQNPGPLFPAIAGKLSYAPGDYPRAEAIHHATLKLPVWHREQDLPLVDRYIEAIDKVVAHHSDLKG
ncbi:dTDP-4-amino-4,6-dideoxygalactose transaminase [Nocardia amikacinitolerans]|uniref:DegT/DnrJ/EryC1/StrS family aminotransferase n=1 Tax=Nocardia amikacinitolerans TaxID=756689 RepID=UPI0020A4323D|nr:DegT/DnrJ/EryC1/StrS family aminotransferase [Nocardia amikacinitolerans]MCP2297587.1 dTDP-4-amino-4,6-dideoxygalactose transaminase [Nocardia amikacinitolerans]